MSGRDTVLVGRNEDNSQTNTPGPPLYFGFFPFEGDVTQGRPGLT